METYKRQVTGNGVLYPIFCFLGWNRNGMPYGDEITTASSWCPSVSFTMVIFEYKRLFPLPNLEACATVTVDRIFIHTDEPCNRSDVALEDPVLKRSSCKICDEFQ